MSEGFFSRLFSKPSLDKRTPIQLTEAVKAGDRQALSSLERLAHSGNPDAQLEIGFLCAKGIGLPQSFQNAALWYSKAADQGVINAQYNIGVMHLKGEGVDQNYEVALACFEKVASKGHENARKLVEQLTPAVKSLREEQLLNNMLGRGGVAGVQNNDLAIRYLAELEEIASSEDVRQSIQTHMLGLGISPIYINEVRRCVELAKQFSSTTGAPVQEVLEMVASEQVELLRRKMGRQQEMDEADDDDDPNDREETDVTAVYNQGVGYLNGQGGFPRDLAKAYTAFRSAAEKGHIGAQHNLAVMYNTGTYVAKDQRAAAQWFAKAADAGHANAAFNLAHLFLTGSGVTQNNQQAHTYLCVAADNGHVGALEYVHKFLASKGLDKDGNPLR